MKTNTNTDKDTDGARVRACLFVVEGDEVPRVGVLVLNSARHAQRLVVQVSAEDRRHAHHRLACGRACVRDARAKAKAKAKEKEQESKKGEG